MANNCVSVGGILFVYPEGANSQSVSDALTCLLLCWVVASKQTTRSLAKLTEDLGKVGWIRSGMDTNNSTGSLAQLSDSVWRGIGWTADQRETIAGVVASQSSNAAVRDAWWRAVSDWSSPLAPALTIATLGDGEQTNLAFAFANPVLLAPALFVQTPATLSVGNQTEIWSLNEATYSSVRAPLEEKVAKYRDLIVR